MNVITEQTINKNGIKLHFIPTKSLRRSLLLQSSARRSLGIQLQSGHYCLMF